MTETSTDRIQLDKMAFEVADMLRIHAEEKQVTINAHRNKKPVYILGNPDHVGTRCSSTSSRTPSSTTSPAAR